MSTVTQDARTALAAKLDDQFSVVRKYDSQDIHGSSYVTIGSPDWQLREQPEQPDQQYGVASISFPIHCYTLIDAADASQAYVDANFHKVLAALGGDRTLGGKVPSCDLESAVSTSYWRTESGQMYAITTFVVVVTPFANVA
jgi:hypothetical protein